MNYGDLEYISNLMGKDLMRISKELSDELRKLKVERALDPNSKESEDLYMKCRALEVEKDTAVKHIESFNSIQWHM